MPGKPRKAEEGGKRGAKAIDTDNQDVESVGAESVPPEVAGGCDKSDQVAT